MQQPSVSLDPIDKFFKKDDNGFFDDPEEVQ